MRARRWTDARIERGLRTLIARHQGRWPTQREFREAGEVALRVAVQRHGGARYWAERMGCLPPRPGQREKWSEKRIVTSLDEFLTERDRWPSASEFRSEGEAALYRALQRHGGASVWAERMGFEAPRRGRPVSAS